MTTIMHHDHEHGSELSETQLRVRALEIDPDRERLCRPGRARSPDRDLRDQGRPAQRRARRREGLERSGFHRAPARTTRRPPIADGRLCGPSGRAHGRAGEHAAVHNMVVCTLCSCYPWPVLGLPPVWYKSAPYRSRAVIDPRGVLREFGVELPDDIEIRVWDSTAEMRYLVLPMRPAGTEGWSEERSPRSSRAIRMIGTGLPKIARASVADERRSRHGRHARLRPGRARAERAGVSRRVGEARLRADARDGHAGRLEHRHVALRAREPPAGEYLVDDLLPDLARRPGKADGRARPRVARTRSRPAMRSARRSRCRARSRPDDVAKVLYRGGPTERETNTAPRVSQPATACARGTSIPPTHTRLPRYVRGHVGMIERVHGCHVFPDSQFARAGREPAMALHGALRRARAVGRRTPIRA